MIERVPCTDYAIDGHATRVAVCRPELVVDVDCECIWNALLRSIFRASQCVYMADRDVHVSSVLETLQYRTETEALNMLSVWNRLELGDARAVNPAALAEALRLLDLRRQRRALLEQLRAIEDAG